MSLISLNNINKSYGNLQILSDINLQIAEHDSYAIIGKSGSGKSTLLHICSLIDKPTDGQLFYNGQEISNISENEKANIRNLKFGYIFQDHYLLEDYNLYENVIIPAMIKGNIDDDVKNRAMYLIGSLNLTERIKHFPKQLSGGEKQRIAICRALINNPDIIFADEPTGSLDEENANNVENILLDIVKKENKTLLLVTHNNDFANKCNNILCIKNHTLERIK